MLTDSQYIEGSFKRSEQTHKYGENVHLIHDPYLSSLLARFCEPSCHQPMTNQLLTLLYQSFVKYVISSEFELVETMLQTRMSEAHPEGNFKLKVVDPRTRVVTVGLARAGTVPSQICFDTLNFLLSPEGVRQDHISINRKTNTDEKVVGTDLGGVKIGGDVKNAYVFFPDPMGATGSTLKTAVKIYKDEVPGPSRKLIAMHLIVTPEYLKTVKEACPELIVYALRLDRGLSPKEVLGTVPGTHWEKERGLNEKHYIVPGAGGIGELINNSYV